MGSSNTDNEQKSIIEYPKILLNQKPLINLDDKNIEHILFDTNIKQSITEAMVYNGNNKSIIYNLGYSEISSLNSEYSDSETVESDENENNSNTDNSEIVLEFILYEVLPLTSILLTNGDTLTLPAETSITGPIDINWGKNTLHIEDNYSLSNCNIEIIDNDLYIIPLSGENGLNNTDSSSIISDFLETA